MKKHILSIFIFISIITQTIAQVATVTGKITDAQTQKPIQGVAIRVKGKLAGTQTNANGSFSISLKTPASIVVTMIGYEAKTVDVTNNQAIDISLSPANSELDQFQGGYCIILCRIGWGMKRSIGIRDFYRFSCINSQRFIRSSCQQ